MSFQFYCPQGHLLQVSFEQVGQHCQCPFCGTVMMVPTPPGMANVATPAPAAPVYAEETPEEEQEEEDFSLFSAFGAEGEGEEQEEDVIAVGEGEETVQQDPNRIIHIGCPECEQVLPTPISMVNEDAMCPHCGAIFRLRYEDSHEAEEEREIERERKEREFSNKALNWAIMAAVLIGCAIVGMIFIIANS